MIVASPTRGWYTKCIPSAVPQTSVPAPATAKVPLAKLALPARPTVPTSVCDQPFGTVVTVKLTPLLFTPPTFTTTFPVVAPVGTVTVMLAAVQVLAVAWVPLNFTVLPPCGEPKFVPLMVIMLPTIPEVAERLVMLGLVA